MSLKAPFPYFGGKSRVAKEVWDRLGKLNTYIEPFMGSMAVLLNNPSPASREIVNDKDGLLVNFWRALKMDKDGVAEHFDHPATEADKMARHAYIVRCMPELLPRLEGDPEFFSSRVAGYWLYSLNLWIGGSFCSGSGPWHAVNKKMTAAPKAPEGGGVSRQVLNPGGSFSLPGKLALLDGLSKRLRNVAICNGDYSRVISDAFLGSGLTGVFLDPPYATETRSDVYKHENYGLAKEIQDWCVAHQDNKDLRIILAGYEGEYNLPGWEVFKWAATGGYGNQTRNSDDPNMNHELERLWCSPHCLKDVGKTLSLF